MNLVSASTFENAIRHFYLKFPISEVPQTRSLSSSTTTTSSRTTPTPSYTTYKRVRSATPTGATLPPPVTVGTTNPPQPPTSCEAERQVNDLFDTRLKEGEGKEGVGSRKKGGKEEKGGGEKEVEAAGRQGPGRHPPPNTLAGTPRTCQTTPCNWVTTCHTRMDKMSTPPHSVATNPNTTTHITRSDVGRLLPFRQPVLPKWQLPV